MPWCVIRVMVPYCVSRICFRFVKDISRKDATVNDNIFLPASRRENVSDPVKKKSAKPLADRDTMINVNPVGQKYVEDKKIRNGEHIREHPQIT